jgi:hypothetical protein
MPRGIYQRTKNNTRPKRGGMVRCDRCGKEIYRLPYRLKKSKHYFCSQECSGIASKGRPSPKKGMKYSPLSAEHKRKISKALRGKKYHRIKPPWNKGKICLQLSGKNNPAWKGGKTMLSLRIRHSFQYRQWRSDVFMRDDFTCQECGVKGVYLEADHYPKMFSEILDEYQIKTLEKAFGSRPPIARSPIPIRRASSRCG